MNYLRPKLFAVTGIIFLLPLLILLNAVSPTAFSLAICGTESILLHPFRVLLCEAPSYTGTNLDRLEDTLSLTTGVGIVLILLSVLFKVRQSVSKSWKKKVFTSVVIVLIVIVLYFTLLFAEIIPLSVRCKQVLDDVRICYAFFQPDYWTNPGLEIEYEWVNL